MSNLPIIQRLVRSHSADAAIITHLPDIRWACGFSGSNAILVVTPEAVHFVSDGRYAAQAEAEVRGAQIHITNQTLFGYVKEEALVGETAAVLLQAENISWAYHKKLTSLIPSASWRPVENLLPLFVARKHADEVDRIKAAQAITESVFEHILGVMALGVTEHEIAAEIVYQHLRRGAARMSFEPIVAAGPNGAMPHARYTERALQAGDMVVLDFGCVVDGYASDMTRTVAIGTPEAEAKTVYETVARAQQAAINAAHAGMAASALDGVARQVITDAGYGAYFSHSLGHGVGLQIHEWPSVSYRSDEPLPEQAVITIEPGIYLPGRFGVRIEDMVWLHQDGCTNLTAAPKSLIIL